jgi:hypothetical protein
MTLIVDLELIHVHVHTCVVENVAHARISSPPRPARNPKGDFRIINFVQCIHMGNLYLLVILNDEKAQHATRKNGEPSRSTSRRGFGQLQPATQYQRSRHNMKSAPPATSPPPSTCRFLCCSAAQTSPDQILLMLHTGSRRA